MARGGEDDLEVQIGLTAARLAKQLADVEARMIRTAQRGENAFKTSNERAGKSFDRVAAGADRASRQMTARFTNVGYQVQDIAVQIAGGQGVVRAFSQQLPQLAGGFGLVGVAIGTLAAVAIPLFAHFLTGADNAKQLEESLKTLEEATQAFRAAAEAQGAALTDLGTKYGALTSVAAEALRVQTAQAESAALAALASTADLLAASLGRLNSVTIVSARGNVTTYLEAFSKLRGEFGLSEQAASSVLNALNALAAAEGPVQVADAARALRAELEQAFGSAEKMPAPVRQLYDELNNSVLAAAELQGGLDDAGQAAEVVEQIAAQINSTLNSADGSALQAAFSGAFPLANQLLGVAQGIVNTLNRARTDAAQMQFDRGNKAYSGRGGDPRKFMYPEGSGPFVPSPEVVKAADAVLNPVGGSGGGRRGGSGGGAGRADADKEAKAFESIFEQGQREIEQLRQKLDLVGKSREETARLTAEYELLNAAKKAGLDLDQISTQTGLTLRDQITQQAAAIANLTEKYTLAKQQAEFFDGIQEQLQDGFIDAIVSGQDFAGVLADVAKQLAKAFLQAALFGKGPLTGLFGGSSGKGLLSGLFGFADGGYTGNGGKNQPAGIVHRGEYVFDKSATKRIGVRRLEALRSGLKGYASGGLVGGGGGGRSAAVNVTSRPQVTVALIDSEEKFGDFLQTNPRAEQGVVAIMRRNGY